LSQGNLQVRGKNSREKFKLRGTQNEGGLISKNGNLVSLNTLFCSEAASSSKISGFGGVQEYFVKK